VPFCSPRLDNSPVRSWKRNYTLNSEQFERIATCFTTECTNHLAGTRITAVVILINDQNLAIGFLVLLLTVTPHLKKLSEFQSLPSAER
jgi:hypothetical protein